MAFFAAVFAALTLWWGGLAPGSLALLPFAAFVPFAIAAARVDRSPGDGIEPSPAGERAITAATIAEGVGLFAVNAVPGWLAPGHRLPAMAAIVGLHFLPIGLVERFRPFLVLGAALIAASVAGWFADAAIAGFGSAAVLWIAAALATRRDARAKRMSLSL